MDHLTGLVNSCLLPAYGGAAPPDWLKRALDDSLAGIVLYGANLGLLDGRIREDVTAPLRALRPDLVIALDEEGGDITRAEYHRGSNYPGNLALGVVDDTALTAEVASAIAADLRDLGVTVNLAPSADVCPGFHLPVFGTRSFGPDPERVAAHTRAFVEATQRHRVAATAKHFPGLGATRVDSHYALPVVDAPEEVFRARDLTPFAHAVEAGVQAVMTGHVVVEAIDSVPATFSERLLRGVLRGELGFEGVVISDALDMKAAQAGVGIGGAAVRAWQASVDLVITGPQDGEKDCAEILDSARRAIADGSLPLARLEEAAERVARLRAWTSTTAEPAAGGGAAGLAAARRAVELRGPRPTPSPYFVVELRPEPSISCGTVPWGLTGPLARLGGLAGQLTAAPGTPPGELRVPDGVPAAVVVRAEAADAWQTAVLAALTAARPDTVVVDMGFHDLPVPAGTTVLKTYGAGLVNALAAAEVLTGRRAPGPPRDTW
ncbi:glycoside hydrolase family 3 protein [Streptomyces sp. NBC_00250]|uniref:glycoside hydrolase family 3 protein n=1 Tax=Streptomyces sp. NBC_00250 TaxID=2903641 RepID=UPI002E2D03BB|nr:glycoside hydrolase family 3 N-terminal domain-containing protein [Streptomyces sp. NBC_00250]